MTMKTIKVLLVDDHTILRDGIKSLLETEDHIKVVGEAVNGEEALQKVEKLSPDVVLMDISMPKMNGIQATSQISEEYPDIKILILTMHDEEGYVQPIFQAGAAGYVVKRTATRELVSAIEGVVEGNTILHPSVTETLLAEGQGSDSDDGDMYDGLTERELEVLTLIAEGLTNQEIADELYISIKTVQAHRANIMDKLGLNDRVALTKYAIRKGLISL